MKDEEKTKAQLISELAALRRSEERYRRLLDEMSDGYVVTHRDHIVFANRPIAEMLGCSVEEIIGRLWKDFFESELVDYIDQTPMEDLPPLLTAQARRPDGGTLIVELALRPATYRGELAEFTLVRDVTERVRAEEALWQRTDQLEALREMGLELAAQLDLDVLLHSIVSRAAELLGGTSGSLYLHQPHRDVLEWHVAVGPHPAVTGTIIRRGEGLVGMVWETGEALVVDDYRNWEGRVLSFDGCPFVAVVGVPVRWGDEFLGVLEVLADTPGRFSSFDAELLGLFASQAAIAICNANLHRAEREQRELAEALEEAAAAVSSTLDTEQVLDRILEQVERVVDGDVFNVMLVEGEDARIVRCRGHERVGVAGPTPQRVIPIDKYPNLKKMAQTGQPVVIQDTDSEPDWIPRKDSEWRLSYVAAPIRISDRTVGFLNVNGTRRGQFSAADARRLKSFANHAAAAIENAQLHRELRDHAEALEQRVQERTAQLAAQYARLEAILHSVSDGIVVVDGRGEVLEINPVANKWLAHTFASQDASRLQETVRYLAQRAEEHPKMVLELTGMDLELKAAPVMEQPGEEVAAAVVAVHDVSHLRALDRMKTRFVSNVSHELRTPVANIKLYASMLRMGRRPEKTERYLEVLEMQSDQLMHLIQDILEITALDSSQAVISWEPIFLPILVGDAVARYQSQAKAAGLTLQAARLPPDLPTVQGDPARLSQALGELVENALIFTPTGGEVTVEVEILKEAPEHWLTVAVRDTGPGISDGEQARVFDRFYRGSLAKSGHVPGAGLGLSIVDEIIRAHRGQVTIESKLGQGSTFTLWLPLGERQD